MKKVNLTEIREKLKHLEFFGKEDSEEDWLIWNYSCLGEDGELSEMIIKKGSEELANTFVEDFINFFKDNLEAVVKVSEYIKKNYENN